MATHSAVVTIGLKAPLDIIQVPTITPTDDQVRVRVEWTASTPLDLHQNDGGLLVTHPQVLGDGIAGTVVELGPDVKRLKVGDKVFGFAWREQKEKAHQDFCTSNEWLFGKLPEGFTMQEAVTLPNNFVTVFHTITADLGIQTPWPKPADYVPPNADQIILIWGGSSSVGQFAIQILNYYGYTRVFTTASQKHHPLLRSLGAERCFDYRPSDGSDVVGNILKDSEGSDISLIFDCIGSLEGSIKPISKLARKRGTRVAVLLPVIIRDSSDTEAPIYGMDVTELEGVDWEDGVDARGVRTHHYLQSEFFKYHLQPDIMPTLLKEKVVLPNAQRIVEGKTLLERAQKAMDTLRRKEQSGERLVWRVSDV